MAQTLMAPAMEDLKVTVLNSENSQNLADFVKKTLNLTLTEDESKKLADFGANTVLHIGNQLFVPQTAQHIANWAGQTADQARFQILTPQAAKHLGFFASESASQAVNQLHEPVSLAAVTATENTASRLINNAVRNGRRLILQNFEPLRQIGYGAGMAATGYYVLPYVTTPAKSTAVTTAGVGMMGWGTYGLSSSLGKANDRSQASANALAKAAQEGDVHKLKQLISRKASINRLDEQNCSALYRAAEHGQVNAAQFLIEHGADLQLGFPLQNRSPLWIAAQNGHTEVVNILIDSGAAFNMADENGVTPLRVAQAFGHSDIVRDLLSVKALGLDSQPSLPKKLTAPFSQRLPGPLDRSPQSVDKLCGAISNDNIQALKKLVKQGVDFDALDSNDCTPLYRAAQKGKLQAAEFLVQMGATVEKGSTTVNQTPLWVASRNGHTDIAKLLINAGANLNTPEVEGNQTPLWAASCCGHTDIAKLLINAGANLNTSEVKHNRTPLWIASSRGHTEIAKLIINAGAELNIPSKSKHTPLQLAVENGHTEIAEALHAAGAK
ncbi:ankyrin repeat domain-containing protein [Vampirovibrio sp.]|uniref:ankyrin repeat domain-containing protein n=1 Tax=Vampirovibrio sp. TaxID=2717857 RepID=UPI003593AE68